MMSWFRKKVEMEVVGPDGKPKRVKTFTRQLDRWVAGDKIARVDCQIFILDPRGGERLETRRIEEVGRETYDRFKDENGHLYVLVYYADGKRSQHVVGKGIWETVKSEQRCGPESADPS